MFVVQSLLSSSFSLLLSFHIFAFVVRSSLLLSFPNCYRYHSDETLLTSSPLHLKEFECEHVCVSLTHPCTRKKSLYILFMLCSQSSDCSILFYIFFFSPLFTPLLSLFPIIASIRFAYNIKRWFMCAQNDVPTLIYLIASSKRTNAYIKIACTLWKGAREEKIFCQDDWLYFRFSTHEKCTFKLKNKHVERRKIIFRWNNESKVSFFIFTERLTDDFHNNQLNGCHFYEWKIIVIRNHREIRRNICCNFIKSKCWNYSF